MLGGWERPFAFDVGGRCTLAHDVPRTDHTYGMQTHTGASQRATHCLPTAARGMPHHLPCDVIKRTPCDGRRGTALHRAAAEGHADVAELLLSHGADVHAVDNDGCLAPTACASVTPRSSVRACARVRLRAYVRVCVCPRAWAHARALACLRVRARMHTDQPSAKPARCPLAAGRRSTLPRWRGSTS
jgi:hypothetical protein